MHAGDDLTRSHAYRDASQPVPARVADLLGRMTLEEKVGQLAGPFGAELAADEDGRTLSNPAAVGLLTHLLRPAELPPPAAARRLNAFQWRFVEQTRLGIPALFSEEACCGPQVRGASMFPQPIALAAAWDPEIIEATARASARQLLALGVRQALAPVCDVARDPRWGRVEETFGEDPYLVGVAASAFVRGLQGTQISTGVIATLKHFIAYSLGEGGRNGQPVHVGPRTLREIFGLPFEMVIAASSPGAVMTSYNAIDQIPVQSSRELLTELLRQEYGFDGVLVSDLNAVMHLHTRHRTASGPREAGVQALRAGLDVELGVNAFAQPLIEAVRAGEVSEAAIDAAVSRVLTLKLRLGLFERPYADESAVPAILDTAADRALARRAAARCIVLLHNPHNVLPLATSTKTIAVIGPNADRPLAMLGDYAYSVIQSAVRLQDASFDPRAREARGADSPAALAHADALELAVESVPVVTLLEGVRAAVGPDVDIHYARGCPVIAPDRSEFDLAVTAARGVDVAIVAVGDQSSLAAGGAALVGTVGEGIDSARCELPGVQAELVQAIAATGTPVVLVLLHGRPFALGDLVDRAAAVVDAWFPGEEGGNALADVLFGKVAPAGRSPVTYHRDVGLVPAPYNRTQSINTYFDTTLEPLFPFGHGLTYTTFEYADFEQSADMVRTDGELTVSCLVTNIGTRASDEVVQLYVRDPFARSVRPCIELKGFQRLHLAPGERARVRFTLAADRFALYDPSDGWVVEPGRIELFIGASSADLRLQGALELVGDIRRPDGRRVLVTPADIEPG